MTRAPLVEKPGHVEQWLFTTDFAAEGTWILMFRLREWLAGPVIETREMSFSSLEIRELYEPSVVAVVQRRLGLAPDPALPYPLTAPDGTVRLWACPRCHKPGSTPSRLGPMTAEDIARYAAWSREEAERCCHCQRCKGWLEEGVVWGTCEACKPAEEAEKAAREAGWEEDRKRREQVVQASLAASRDPRAAEVLRALMREISEEHWCSGWEGGLEFDLWAIVQGGSADYGAGEVTEANVQRLHDMAERSGGWWRWEQGTGEVFVGAEEWTRLYAERKSGK